MSNSGISSEQKKGQFSCPRLNDFFNDLNLLVIVLRKMVNVASRIPFNLHNQIIPKEQSYSASASRSTSCSMDDYYDERYHPLNAYLDPSLARKAARRRQKTALSNSAHFRRAGEDNSRSPSPSNGGGDAGPSTRTARSSSCVTEQPRPTPILNVRLVGYKETRVRGRTLQRGPGPSGLPSSSYMVSKDEPGANEVNEHTTTSDEGDQPPPSTPRKVWFSSRMVFAIYVVLSHPFRLWPAHSSCQTFR